MYSLKVFCLIADQPHWIHQTGVARRHFLLKNCVEFWCWNCFNTSLSWCVHMAGSAVLTGCLWQEREQLLTPNLLMLMLISILFLLLFIYLSVCFWCVCVCLCVWLVPPSSPHVFSAYAYSVVHVHPSCFILPLLFKPSSPIMKLLMKLWNQYQQQWVFIILGEDWGVWYAWSFVQIATTMNCHLLLSSK